MAHYGVLYLDEILEFRKETLETLRGPLEDKEVTISRLWASLTYPCNFMLIASMNPCPCGYYGSSIKNCICSPTSIKRYLSKLSGPLLDRIDINVNIQPLEYQNFKENEKIETSKQIKERVEKAIKMQRERYANMDILYNSELTPKLIERYCKLDNVGNKIMEKAFINYSVNTNYPSNFCLTEYFSLLLQLSFCGLSAMRRWRESKAWPIFRERRS